MHTVVMMWYESLIQQNVSEEEEEEEEEESLNAFFTHNLSNIVPTLFYLSAPPAIFS